ncbi:MAG: class I SAM-dependent methyltransferase [Methylotenera sp.]|nr:class I SAM-dependent methyltransferase [Oligoflexia bacterium]
MPADLESAQTFLSHLSAHAHILEVGCGNGETLEGWKRLGFSVEGYEASAELTREAQLKGLDVQQRDLRLLSPKKEFYDAVWCHQAIATFTIDECHRILGSLFKALRPKTGLLFISFLNSSDAAKEALNSTPGPSRSQDGRYRHPLPAFFSLLRQSGFTVFLHGSRQDAAQDSWTAIFARRS